MNPIVTGDSRWSQKWSPTRRPGPARLELVTPLLLPHGRLPARPRRLHQDQRRSFAHPEPTPAEVLSVRLHPLERLKPRPRSPLDRGGDQPFEVEAMTD